MTLRAVSYADIPDLFVQRANNSTTGLISYGINLRSVVSFSIDRNSPGTINMNLVLKNGQQIVSFTDENQVNSFVGLIEKAIG